MKIGILSLVLHTNYGGIIQSYALQTVLERMGHKVVVFTRDRSIKYGFLRQLLSDSKTIVKRYLLHRDAEFVCLKKMEVERKERERNTRVFIDRYIHTRFLKKLQGSEVKDLDAIVVGSDQVWRSGYFRGHWNTALEDAFLKFVEKKNIKKVAYAASFGTDEWEFTEEETSACSRLIQLFDAVGVREESGVDLCREKLLRNDAICVLDPTLLLSKEDYIELVNNTKEEKNKGNLMCYVLDMSEDKQIIIDHIAQSRHLKPFTTNSRIDNFSAPQKDRIQPPLEQWLNGFMRAEFVVTDSFHACVFSIIFGKPFVVVGNSKRGLSRFDSLLSMFGLSDHMIMTENDYKEDYDYSIPAETYEILASKKQESMQFLHNSLSN